MNITSPSPTLFGARLPQAAPRSTETPLADLTPQADRFVKFGAKSDYNRVEKPGEYIRYERGTSSVTSFSPYGRFQSLVDEKEMFPLMQQIYRLQQPEEGGIHPLLLDIVYDYLLDNMRAKYALRGAEEALTLNIPDNYFNMGEERWREWTDSIPYDDFRAIQDCLVSVRNVIDIENADLRDQVAQKLRQPAYADNALVKGLLETLDETPPAKSRWTPAFIEQFAAALSREIPDVPDDHFFFRDRN